MIKNRFRQIHLDFHTSPFIPGVGEDFNPQEFVTTLKNAQVNAINITAKGHHGYSYYPTKVGIVHPSLKRDLLGEMIDVLRRENIMCLIYYSLSWDEYAAEQHADWLQIDINGKIIGRPPLGTKGWRFLCLNSPYFDYVKAQMTEIMEMYEVNGFWFDGVSQHPDGCLCSYCRKSMKEMGFDISNYQDRLKHNLMVERKTMKRLTELIHQKKPGALVIYNDRSRLDNRKEKSVRPELPHCSRIDLESLPSAYYGYLHFPMHVRYFQTLGKEIVGMTGRFHKHWGDFGGLKNQSALDFECNRILSLGAKVCIGDQMHPRGHLDRITYELIGNTFRQIKNKESWCKNSKLDADIGVLLCTQSDGTDRGPKRGLDSDEGATRMLMELHQQFHLIDSSADLSLYKVIIAPDDVPLDKQLTSKLKNYLKQGGSLLLTNESALDKQSKRFLLSEIGVKYLGKSEYNVDYVRFKSELNEKELATDYDYVLYEGGSKIKAKKGTKIYAIATHPYFNRSSIKFCSHEQTPPEKQTKEPVIVKKDRVIYISAPLFRSYRHGGYRAYKLVISSCLKKLLPEALIYSNLPSTAELTILKQKERRIIHILHYIPQRRAEIDIVEDVIPLYNIELKVYSDKKVKRVYLAPQEQEVKFNQKGSYVFININKVEGHQMIVLE